MVGSSTGWWFDGHRGRAVLVVGLLGLVLLSSGCVRRRMTIRTNPPGAAVYIDDYPKIGTSPASASMIYYGRRKFRIVKPGFETLTTLQSIPLPWYEIPPLDFISENLIPWEIRDERTFNYQLVPSAVVPSDELLERANRLRAASQDPDLPIEQVPPGRPSPYLQPSNPLPYQTPAPPRNQQSLGLRGPGAGGTVWDN